MDGWMDGITSKHQNVHLFIYFYLTSATSNSENVHLFSTQFVQKWVGRHLIRVITYSNDRENTNKNVYTPQELIWRSFPISNSKNMVLLMSYITLKKSNKQGQSFIFILPPLTFNWVNILKCSFFSDGTIMQGTQTVHTTESTSQPWSGSCRWGLFRTFHSLLLVDVIDCVTFPS